MTNSIVSLSAKMADYCRQHPWRFKLATLCLVTMFWFIYSGEVLYAIIAVNGLIQSLFLGHSPKHYEQEFVPDVLAQLKLEQDLLHVKQRQLKVAEIKQVVLDKLDNEHAFIDFPFNIYRSAAMRFPVAQLPAAKAWLNQHLPHAEIIR